MIEEPSLESRGGLGKAIITLLFLGIIAFGVVVAFQTWKRLDRVQTLGESVKTNLSQAAQKFVPENFSKAKTHLEEANQDLDEIVVLLKKSSVLRYIPFWKKRYETLLSFATVSEGFVEDGVELVNIVEFITEPVLLSDGTIKITKISPEKKQRILQRTLQQTPRLNGIRAHLILTRTLLENIDESVLSPSLQDIKKDILQKSQNVEYTLGQALPILEVLPSFLAYNQQKTYLLLLQDPRELRPTGGRTIMSGTITLKDATILKLNTSIDEGDVASRDVLLPADFSDVAGGIGGGVEGVIAVTPEFFSSLLRLTGNLRIGNTIFSSEDFSTQLDALKDGEAIGFLTRMIIDTVNEMSFQEIYDVAKVVEARLNEKHMLLWFRDKRLQAFARKNNWTGEIRQSDGDFLMLVDTNTQSKKTDPFIERSISYDLRQDALDDLYVMLEILYRNNATITETTTRYKDTIQIYVPKGSALLSASGTRASEDSREEGSVRIHEEKGYTVFDAFTIVEPFQNQKLRLEYRLPKKLARDLLTHKTYSLLVQKQPGSKSSITATFFFTRPVRHFTDGGFFTNRAGGVGVQFVSDLRVDRNFSVGF